MEGGHNLEERQTRLTNGLNWRCGRQNNTPHTAEITVSQLLEPMNMSPYMAKRNLQV